MNMAQEALEAFSAAEVCHLAGLTPTMLDYLTRERFIVPSCSLRRGRGNRRLYSFADLITLRVIAQLLRSGIEISRLRRGLKNLRKRLGNPDATELPFRFLATDEIDVFLHREGELKSLLQQRQLSFVFLLDLDGFQRRPLRAPRQTQRRRAHA